MGMRTTPFGIYPAVAREALGLAARRAVGRAPVDLEAGSGRLLFSRCRVLVETGMGRRTRGLVSSFRKKKKPPTRALPAG
jgi:hypothetical protein